MSGESLTFEEGGGFVLWSAYGRCPLGVDPVEAEMGRLYCWMEALRTLLHAGKGTCYCYWRSTSSDRKEWMAPLRGTCYKWAISYVKKISVEESVYALRCVYCQLYLYQFDVHDFSFHSYFGLTSKWKFRCHFLPGQVSSQHIHSCNHNEYTILWAGFLT